MQEEKQEREPKEKRNANIETMPSAHREFSDRLFCFIFGSEEHKEWMLSLYNAVNHTNYADPSLIQFNTIKEVLYLGMHNDVSVLIHNEIGLFEQQSTYSPNLPLRELQYLANLFEKYLQTNRLRKYGRKAIKLPVPRLIVLYNGEQDMPDEIISHLSDFYLEPVENPDVDVSVRILNINYGRNRELMEKCEPLREYAWFIHEVRKNRKMIGLTAAVDEAIRKMPEEFLLKPLLLIHRSEVKKMLLTEYNEVEVMAQCRDEGYEDGLEDGREEGRLEGRAEGCEEALRNLMNNMKWSAKQAMDALGIPASEQVKYVSKLIE